MKGEILTAIKPTSMPPKRLCAPASDVLVTPTTARFPASHVLWTTQERSLASQENRAAGSGLSGEPTQVGNPAAQARLIIGCTRHRQRSSQGGSINGNRRFDTVTTDQVTKVCKEGKPTLHALIQGREATHYPDTADVLGRSRKLPLGARPEVCVQPCDVRNRKAKRETRGSSEPDRSAAKAV